MLYSRSDIVELVRQEASELQALLISIIWHASQGDPNIVSNERYGLLQIWLTHARQIGFNDHENALLDPSTNIKLGAQLISKLGILEFLGRELAPQFHAIMALERFLADSEASDITDRPAIANSAL